MSLLSVNIPRLAAVPLPHACEQGQVAGLLGHNVAMADEEVDDDQVAVVLELVGVGNEVCHLCNRKPHEGLDLAVLQHTPMRLMPMRLSDLSTVCNVYMLHCACTHSATPFITLTVRVVAACQEQVHVLQGMHCD